MEVQSIFPAVHPWLVAEGSENGKPTLYRGRQIPDQLIGNAELPNLIMIGRPFGVADSTGLPTAEQYQDFDEFEERYLDFIESTRIGIVAFVKTHDGIVRYFIYVASLDQALNALPEGSKQSLRLEVSTRDDPDWAEFRCFLHGLGIGG